MPRLPEFLVHAAVEKDIGQIKACIGEHGIEVLKIEAIERDINPMRDKYC